MRMLFLLLFLIVMSNAAYAENVDFHRPPLSKDEIDLLHYLAKKFPCPEDSVKSCFDKETLDDEENLGFQKIDLGKYEIVEFSDLFAYQANAILFLKKDSNYYPLPTLMMAGFDKKNMVFKSWSKARGIGDIGTVEFYKLDLVHKKLRLVKQFSTDEVTSKNGKTHYVDENGKRDVELGYDNRSENYAKKNGFKFE